LLQLLMFKLDTLLQRRHKLVIGLWVVALFVAVPFAAHQTDRLTGGGFEDPHAQSTAVAKAVARSFPSVSNVNLSLVLVPLRNASSLDLKRAILATGRAVSHVKGVGVEPEGRQGALISARIAPSRTVIIPLDFKGDEERAIDIAAALRARLGIANGRAGRTGNGRVDSHVVGQGAVWAAFQQQAKEDSTVAEVRAFPVIAVVLLLVFGSLAAMALPLGLGIAVVIITGAVVYALSQIATMSVYVTSTASLIGIGVAVDYSLFVLARYRKEVGMGRPFSQARAAAMATSGLAVLFSAITVITSLIGMFFINSTAVRSIAAGAIVVVTTSVLATATLLPALISLFDRRMCEPGRVAKTLQRWRVHRRSAPRLPFWERWTSVVMRHAVVSVVAATMILLVLAAPAISLRIGGHVLDQLPPQNEIRQGTQAVAKLLGPGTIGPALVLVDFKDGSASDSANRQALSRLQVAIESDPAVSYVVPALISPDARSAELTTVFGVNPESQAAEDAVARLRARLPRITRDRAEVKVGGTTAVILDFDNAIAHTLWKIIVFVLALTFVVLLLLLRSIVLPIKAVIMNTLSVGVAYGALVVVFQWGWLEFLGLHKVTSIESFSLPLILVVTFGLSMDYEIFLLMPIRESYIKTGDNRRAVAEGLASSARIITSAALIMITVCIAFVGSGIGALQRLGLATAVALAVDATIVRLVLVPAAMTLLGKWNWWMPAPLARVLPTVHGEALDTNLGPISWAESHGEATRLASQQRR
jgi:uncharacterized membrane protein YdfJ with MMPL/SSD domain